MITHIEGPIIEKNPAYVVIDCNGVGYLLNISLHTYSSIGDLKRGRFFTHLSIKEDAHTLYGFFDEDERSLFRHLISVSGVGASTARLILSSLSPTEVQQAIVDGNVALLQKIKGIGSKSAQRIVVDLRDKFQKKGLTTSNIFVQNNTVREEALTALQVLGFNKAAAEKTIDTVLKKETGSLSVEELIKQVLKSS